MNIEPLQGGGSPGVMEDPFPWSSALMNGDDNMVFYVTAHNTLTK